MHFWVSRSFIWFWKLFFETFIRTLWTYTWTQPAFCVLGPELINFWWVFHGYYGSITWKVDGVGFLVVVGRVKGVNMAGESIRWPRGEFHSLSIDWTARSLYQIVGFRFFAIFNWWKPIFELSKQYHILRVLIYPAKLLKISENFLKNLKIAPKSMRPERWRSRRSFSTWVLERTRIV